MKKLHLLHMLFLGSLLLVATGCNMPGGSSGGQSQADLNREWEGKGFGFVWDDPTADGQLRFSGVAYGCTINDFYANLELSGPLGDGTNVHLLGSAAMTETPIDEPAPSTATVYALEVPLTGSINWSDAVCDAQYMIWLSVRVDLATGMATIVEATGSGNRMTCTQQGVTVSAELPIPLDLPHPADIPINVLETEACRQDLGQLP